jgi:archaellum component FlaG (FlaF/FlaG flagellin family)
MITNTSTRSGTFSNIEYQDPVSGRWVNFQYVTGAVNVFYVPTVTVNDVSLPEGNSGTTPFVFTYNLSDVSTQPVTIQYATADGTATSTPGDADYVPASGTINFAAGTLTQVVTVLVNGDTIYDRDVFFTVGLSFATGAHLSRGNAIGTIRNDDPAPGISIGDVSAPEGNSGTTAFSFTVSLLSGVSEVPAVVSWATADGTAPTTDYVHASGTVTFNPGETSKLITVLVNGNTAYEHNETFLVNLSNPVDATIGPRRSRSATRTSRSRRVGRRPRRSPSRSSGRPRFRRPWGTRRPPAPVVPLRRPAER